MIRPLIDRPYHPETWERKAGAVYYSAGESGEPMPNNPKNNKYFEYLYACGQGAAMRAPEVARQKAEDAYQEWVAENGEFLRRFLHETLGV